MARSSQSFARRAKYGGPRAFCSGEEVGFVPGFYALDSDGKSLLLRGGDPVRLTHVDLAPEDPDDGKEEFLIAGLKDPPQTQKGRLVELEPDPASGSASVGS